MPRRPGRTSTTPSISEAEQQRETERLRRAESTFTPAPLVPGDTEINWVDINLKDITMTYRAAVARGLKPPN